MFSALFTAIMTTMLIVALGTLATALGVLTPAGAREINTIQIGLLGPCFCLATLIRISADTLAQSLPLVGWCVLHVGTGLTLGALLLPRSRRRGVLLLVCGFGNPGGLPTAILPSLLRPFGDAATSEALQYVQLYIIWWQLIMWSVGPLLLARCSGSEPDAASAAHKKTDGDEMAKLKVPELRERLASIGQPAHGLKQDLVQRLISATTSEAAAAAPPGGGTGSLSLRKLLPPPAVASLAGIALGCMPPVQRLVGDGAPLQPALRALYTLGDAGDCLA